MWLLLVMLTQENPPPLATSSTGVAELIIATSKNLKKKLLK